MTFVVLLVIGFIATYQIASSLFILMELNQIYKALHVGFHRDPFLALCFLLYASMIFAMFHNYVILYYMLVTQMFFFQHENASNELDNISSWFAMNKLSHNVSTTQYKIFSNSKIMNQTEIRINGR